MRKGYLLVEMIVVILILVMLSPILGRFFRTFAYELPKDNRLVQEDLILLDAVRHIRADVASAKLVSERAGDSTETSALIMELPDGAVRYEFENGRLLRSKTNAVRGATPDEMTWSIPHGNIETRVWSTHQKDYAVELITSLEDKDLGHIRKKMANNYLFFTGTI